MIFSFEYHEKVVKEDIPNLSKVNRRRIKRAIEDKLVYKPEVFGKPSRKSLKGYRKLRVGNYRVVFRIARNVVKVIVILHRSEVYRKAELRIK